MQTNNTSLEQSIWQWLDDVVIGLNLCPFAKKPRINQQIKLYITDAINDEDLLNELMQELQFIEQVDPLETDTTLFAISHHLQDFEEYLNFLAIANLMVQQLGLEGKFQLASFHPNYQFEGTTPTDRENLTNKAPCPLIHIIREATVEKVLNVYPNPEQIPDNNIECVENLSNEQVQRLFPFLSN
ncbi:MAG: DUF1415 domain-containing protein [Gammaproteobacteria bacterium]|nr:DUF1415 domain-containing protein [Gammaproteobacteria bacterium]